MLCCSFHTLCSNHFMWPFMDSYVPSVTVIYLHLWWTCLLSNDSSLHCNALCPNHPVLPKIVWVQHLDKLSPCNNTTTLTKTEGHNTTTASTKGAFNNTTPPAVPYGCLDILVTKMNFNILEFFIWNDFPLQRISVNSSDLVREGITSMHSYESIFCSLGRVQYQHF